MNENRGNARGSQRVWRRLLLAALVLFALALDRCASVTPALIEQAYSRRIYPVIAAGLRGLTSSPSWSLAEGLLCALLVWTLFGFVSVVSRLFRRTLGGREALLSAVDAMAALGGVYCAFVLLWGLNYRRLPYAASAGLDTSPAAVGELVGLAQDLVLRTNRARAAVSEDSQGVMVLVGGPRAALQRVGEGYRRAAVENPAVAGLVVPKPVLLSPVLSYLGITGIYSPFTGEANVNMTLPDPEIAFSASHEAAHALGFAREDEANYLAYLACRLHPDADFQYSGLLAASSYALAALRKVDHTEAGRIEPARSPAVRRDLAALARWQTRYRGRTAAVSRAVNDAYLRTQGQAEGVRSYGRMVDLLIAERRSEAGREERDRN